MNRPATPRPRARDLGIVIGPTPTGPLNALTDVSGVRVGHTTVRSRPDVHSGVTAIVPDGVRPGAPLPAGLFVGNGYGKLVGATQLAELGELETPVLLTSTLSAFRVADALVGWVLEQAGNEGVLSLNPVVGECNDGFLSDIRSRPVREEHVRAALDGASAGPVAEGCVGAGTGTVALGYKAGIGTSSRTPEVAGGRCTVGALVQANFGGTLRVLGRTLASRATRPEDAGPPAETGSCMIVVATDAPLDARQLTRVARRAVFALARTGAAYSHGSGDYAVAFTTTRPHTAPPLADAALSLLFEAVLDTVEEAVLNSLLTATTTTGHAGRTVPALSADRLLADMRLDS
ncbi:P1 family peptidase [Streptomyces lusitanus]|uniref:P1 family peptidase n=1 Tax=Streptomyces lusitanus TaxID=68232 RepID=A0ABU3JMJ3_9ACTN|nr:P1 family peptidase [Streptomyces lusitanus]